MAGYPPGPPTGGYPPGPPQVPGPPQAPGPPPMPAPPPMPGRPPLQQAAAQVTQDDLRSVKRWIAVAVVWAVAATAVALIALLDSSDSTAETRASDTDNRVRNLERSFDRRLRRIDSRIEGLPQVSDTSLLSGRLSRVENQASRASKDAKGASDNASDLEARVKVIEEAARAAGATKTTPAR